MSTRDLTPEASHVLNGLGTNATSFLLGRGPIYNRREGFARLVADGLAKDAKEIPEPGEAELTELGEQIRKACLRV